MAGDAVAREFFDTCTRALLDRDAAAAAHYAVPALIEFPDQRIAVSDAARERNLYQLVRTGDGWRIAVLTPMQA